MFTPLSVRLWGTLLIGLGDLHADRDAVVLAHIGERSLDLLAQVPRDAVRRLGAAEDVLLGEQPLVDLRETSAQPLGDEALEEARPEVIHEEKLRGCADSGLRRTSRPDPREAPAKPRGS
ncbi:MAG: hypothetical protein ABL966_05770 [Acidimicrobiales bacterium]